VAVVGLWPGEGRSEKWGKMRGDLLRGKEKRQC